jgi:hypothetical protein
LFLEAIRKRPGLEKSSQQEILVALGLLFTRTSEENGGREKRRKIAAAQKLAIAAYKQTHPEVEQRSSDEN